MQSCLVDTANKLITISNGFNVAVPAGSSIQIVLGELVNPISYSNTGTFTVQSYTDSTFKYKID